jgi:YYY domain-containing protein
MHLTPRQASAAPDGLQLTPQEQSLYRETAVWSSEAVSERSLGSQFPLLVWPLALVVIGLLALPVTLLTFRNLVDRGYALSKAVGLLLVGWAAWTLASWKIAPFTWWQIVAVMLLVALPSFLLVRRRWDELRNFVKSNWRLLAMEELLFWVFFGISLYIRLQNPDLWHPGMGGEKPMDLAYLTAVVKTPYFPSYDPWFSGGYINYYYFGFVLVATLIHLTGILPVIAYNLAVPTLFAMTAMGGFVAAMNLQQARENDQLEQAGHRFILPRKVLLASLAGALFVVLIGNLAQVKLLWEGVSNLSTLSAGEESGVISALARFTDGLGNAIRGSELPIHTDWWYWNATRVIPPGEGEAGPINEMPFFTFLFADLHAHMLALPYTLLALALIINMLRRLWHRSLVELSALQSKTSRLLNLGLLSLTLGALWPMNTWDFPTYTALAVAALVCMQWVEQGRLDVAGWRSLAWQVGVILIGAWLLFLPYHQNNASAYFGAELWRGSKTPLWAYLYIHGFFLFIIVTWMLLELMKGWGHNSLIRSIRLRLRYWRRPGDLNRLFNRLTRPASGYRLAIGLTVVAFLFSLAALMIKPAFGLSLGLGLLAALLLFERQPNLQRQMLLCMIGLGLALTAVVEVVVLKGDISRMNTVFKFYLQVWVLWAVASAALLPQISSRLHAQPRQKPLPVPEPPEGSTWTPQLQAQYERSRRIRGSLLGRGWWWAFGLLLAACLLYPLTATPVRVGDRFPGSFTTTLDGSAYMQTSVYYDDGRPVPLLSDLNAIRWLRQAPGGLPVVLEANTPLYRWGSRISIYTGFPTVMGWDWHQKQQRSVMPGILIDRRLADVTTIYNTTDVNQARALIAQYQVKFIYVGSLERLYYDSAGLSKFDSNTGFWTRVYESDEVIIYQVH